MISKMDERRKLKNVSSEVRKKHYRRLRNELKRAYVTRLCKIEEQGVKVGWT
jgi:hypothetical protein